MADELVSAASSNLLKKKLQNLGNKFSSLGFLSSPIQSQTCYVSFIKNLSSELSFSVLIPASLGNCVSSFFNTFAPVQPSLTEETKSISMFTIDFFQSAKSRVLWMQERMSEDLRAVALRSKRFKRFLASCSFFSECLETLIRSELAKFWVWASGETGQAEPADSVEILKGGHGPTNFQISRNSSTLPVFSTRCDHFWKII